jgi:ATP-dependent Lhr-like helicase
MLNSEKIPANLRDVETLIVDEIHAVADDKRGAHLTLSLERLDALTHKKPVRIGLSATQKPIEEVARFLTGSVSGAKAPVLEVERIASMEVLRCPKVESALGWRRPSLKVLFAALRHPRAIR